ncbi:MAG: amino acid permease [Elusimicrobia bacterium]|nr:amino acid permease [Candidatus Liberimonas magnetica]
MSPDNEITLKKDLSWWDCSGIIVGIIIGTGIFSIFPTLIAQHNPSLLMILLVWAFGGLFAWFGALCYAELSSQFPSAGGDFTFLKKSYAGKGGNIISFLFAWSVVLIIRPSSIATLALIIGNESLKLLPFTGFSGFSTILVVAAFTITLLTLINISGITLGKNVQNSITIFKIAILIFLIGFGISKTGSSVSNLIPLLPPAKNPFNIILGFWSALVLSMWVYGGWNEAVYIAEETKNGLNIIPKALFAGLATVTLLYIGINFVYIKYLTPEGLAKTFSPASDIMTIWFGTKGGIAMSSIIIISAAGAINGLILTGGRISYAIAKNYPGLNMFSSIHPKYRSPQAALFANFVFTLTLLLISRGNIGFVENLAYYTSGVFWCFMGLVILGLMLARRTFKEENVPYKVPFYPVLPILFLLVTCGLIWSSVKFKPVETLTGLVILSSGVPLYYIFHTKSMA